MKPSTRPMPSGASGLAAGARAVFQGLDRIRREPELRALLAKPLFVTLAIYVALFLGAALWIDDALAWIWPRPDSSFLVALWYVVIVLLFAVAVVLLGLLFSTIAGVVAGPFYDKMVIHVLTRERVPAKEPGVVDGIVNEVVRSALFLVPVLGCAVLGLIPVIGAPFAVIGAVLGGVGLASSALSPVLMSAGLGLGERMRFAAGSKGVLLGMGLLLGASMLVPLLILIALPGAIVGAAALYARSQHA